MHYLRYHKTIFSLLLSLLLSNLLSKAQTVIHMKREGGVSIVPCKINGLNLSFVFDTGAADVSISLTEALYMIKHGLITESDILGISYYTDASGNTSKCYVVNIKSLEFAGLRLTDVRASIANDLNAPLLLGQSALSKLGPIQIDLATNTLVVINGVGNYDYRRIPESYLTNPNSSIENTYLTERNSAPVEITVKDFNGNSIPYAFVVFENTTTKKKYDILCNSNGFSSLRLPVGFTYEFIIIAKDKIKSDEKLQIPPLVGNSYYKNPFKVDIQYAPSRAITIENCEYEKNETSLSVLNFKRLNSLVDYMLANLNSTVLLTGITNRFESNKTKLIENRISPIISFLIGHGISSNRIRISPNSQLNSSATGMIMITVN